MFWLSFGVEGETVVFIQRAQSAIAARMRALLADKTLEARHYKDTLALDAKTAKRIPAAMIGRRLTQAEARKLLRRMAA